MKTVLLLLLLFQNTGLALAVKASKSYEVAYIATTVVFLNEVVKFVVSLIKYHYDSEKRDIVKTVKYFAIVLADKENLKFAFPCVIYAFQNNLIFVVLQYIDAALYQILSNLKIITTAICAVLMLGKTLHRLQWMALVLLAAGEALAENATAKEGGTSSNAFLGTILMCLYATLSGVAGIYTERQLKQNKQPFWVKQMILYFWGTVINLVGMIYNDGGNIATHGFFYGYNGATWLVVFLLSAGGVLVSAIITKFDNIVKVYVTCLSLFLTSIFSYLLFDFHYNLQFVLSAVVVSISVLVYSDPVTAEPTIAR